MTFTAGCCRCGKESGPLATARAMSEWIIGHICVRKAA